MSSWSFIMREGILLKSKLSFFLLDTVSICLIWNFSNYYHKNEVQEWRWQWLRFLTYLSIPGSVTLTMRLSFSLLRLVVIVKYIVVFLSSLGHKLCLKIAVSNLKSSCGFTLEMHTQKCMWLCNVCKRASGNLLSTYLLLAYVAFQMFPCI